MGRSLAICGRFALRIRRQAGKCLFYRPTLLQHIGCLARHFKVFGKRAFLRPNGSPFNGGNAKYRNLNTTYTSGNRGLPYLDSMLQRFWIKNKTYLSALSQYFLRCTAYSCSAKIDWHWVVWQLGSSIEDVDSCRTLANFRRDRTNCEERVPLPFRARYRSSSRDYVASSRLGQGTAGHSPQKLLGY